MTEGMLIQSQVFAFEDLLVEWSKHFDSIDPEPPLVTKEKDRFDHIDKNGRLRGDGWHYATAEVDAHMAWQHRRAKAYAEFLKSCGVR